MDTPYGRAVCRTSSTWRAVRPKGSRLIAATMRCHTGRSSVSSAARIAAVGQNSTGRSSPAGRRGGVAGRLGPGAASRRRASRVSGVTVTSPPPASLLPPTGSAPSPWPNRLPPRVPTCACRARRMVGGQPVGAPTGWPPIAFSNVVHSSTGPFQPAPPRPYESPSTRPNRQIPSSPGSCFCT